MAFFLTVLITGLSYGCAIALAAYSFMLPLKATGIVSFAQGDFISLSAFIAAWFITDKGLNWSAGYIATIFVMFGLGVIFERITHSPLRGRPVDEVIIATLGVSFIIRGFISRWRGAGPQQLESPLRGKFFEVFGAAISYQRLFIIVATIAITGLLYWVFQKTSVGLQLRALASDPEVAKLHGVATRRLAMMAFGSSAAMSGICGILVGSLASFDIGLGFSIMLGGFCAAIIGGWGSLVGALVGGLLLGLIEFLFGSYYFSNFRHLLPLFFLFVFIAARSRGIFKGAESYGRL